MDKNELILFRGNHSIEELSNLLNVNATDINEWEASGEISDNDYIKLKRLYDKDNGERDFATEANIIGKKASLKLLFVFKIILPILFVLAYVLIGINNNSWNKSWIILLFIPLYYVILFQISARKILHCFMIFVIAIIYLYLGVYKNLWHPYWVLFLLALTYSDILKVISYKRWYFFNILPLLIIAYILSAYYTGYWNILWVILLIAIPYVIVQYYFINKRNIKLHRK